MIFLNGHDNPENIAFNDRALENVYFNGTLVWQKQHAQNTDLYGDFTIPESNASDFGVNTGSGGGSGSGSGSGGGGGESTTNPYQEVVGGTAKLFRQSGRTDFYNDLDFVSYVLFRTLTSSGVEMSVGAQYRALLSTELAWPSGYSLSLGDEMTLYSMTSTTNMNEGRTSESGFPSCAKFYRAEAESNISVTLGAELVGDGVYNPSRWVRRSYNAKLYTYENSKHLSITPWGDEYGIYTVTTGLLFQGYVDLYVKQNQ